MSLAIATSAQGKTASGTIATSGGLNTSAGSLLIGLATGYVGGGFSGTTWTPSDSIDGTSGWGNIVTQLGDTTTYARAWYKSTGSRGSGQTFTVSVDTTAEYSACLVQITGHHATLFTNATGGDSQTTGTFSAGLTTDYATTLILALAATRAAFGTINWGISQIGGVNATNIFTDNNAAEACGHTAFYRIVAGAGAYTAVRSHDTLGGGVDWTGVVLAIREAEALPPSGLVVPGTPQLIRHRRYF